MLKAMVWFAGFAMQSEPPPRRTLLEWPGNAAVAERDDAGIATDRPDFTESSATVGKGRAQLEAGYGFRHDRQGTARRAEHSFPEALLRVGVLADWCELRVAKNFSALQSNETRVTGAEDLYLGMKLALFEQQGALPEVALMLQATTPTGARELSARRTLPGLSLLYGWDVVPDKWSVAGSTQANLALDDARREYAELAQSATAGYSLTERLGAFGEWFCFVPLARGLEGPSVQHYLNGGFTFLVTKDLQLDIRAGAGLNRAADDFFAGAGFAIRF